MCVYVWVCAGLLGLSSYLPLPQLTDDLTLSPAAKNTPILLTRYILECV